MLINKGGNMSNIKSYVRKHKHLDARIDHLEKHNHYNRTLISDLKKTKLKLKDKLRTTAREKLRSEKEAIAHDTREALALG
jgi:uncharacterized protein YdcH (DUF465 family)|tara:strand:- start:489 stop:731 length:243 start_codon:yes stop_codon:yes gene_type:complete